MNSLLELLLYAYIDFKCTSTSSSKCNSILLVVSSCLTEMVRSFLSCVFASSYQRY